MNSWAKSHIGKFDLNEEKLNLMFETDNIKFNTTAIATQIPLFQEKLGDDIAMKMEISFKDYKVMFG